MSPFTSENMALQRNQIVISPNRRIAHRGRLQILPSGDRQKVRFSIPFKAVAEPAMVPDLGVHSQYPPSLSLPLGSTIRCLTPSYSLPVVLQ